MPSTSIQPHLTFSCAAAMLASIASGKTRYAMGESISVSWADKLLFIRHHSRCEQFLCQRVTFSIVRFSWELPSPYATKSQVGEKFYSATAASCCVEFWSRDSTKSEAVWMTSVCDSTNVFRWDLVECQFCDRFATKIRPRAIPQTFKAGDF